MGAVETNGQSSADAAYFVRQHETRDVQAMEQRVAEGESERGRRHSG